MKTKTKMWHKIALAMLASLLVIFSTVKAQQQQTSDQSAPTTKFGIKGGLNLTNLHSDDFSDSHLKAGYNVGIFSKIPVTTP
jgi:hypothetical protein